MCLILTKLHTPSGPQTDTVIFSDKPLEWVLMHTITFGFLALPLFAGT